MDTPTYLAEGKERGEDLPSTEEMLFVGDIQGCRRTLEALLAAAHFDPDRHRLVPVGDTINRGPDSVGVLRLLKSLGATPVVGNHEIKICDWIRNPTGERSTSAPAFIQDFRYSPLRDDFVDWIGTWPVWYENEKLIAIHAAIHPCLPLEKTPTRFLVSARMCNGEGEVPIHWDGYSPLMETGYYPWHHFYQGTRQVIYGHWAVQGRHSTRNTLGLDSGCVYGGKLTGFWYQSHRLIEVSNQE